MKTSCLSVCFRNEETWPRSGWLAPGFLSHLNKWSWFPPNRFVWTTSAGSSGDEHVCARCCSRQINRFHRWVVSHTLTHLPEAAAPSHSCVHSWVSNSRVITAADVIGDSLMMSLCTGRKPSNSLNRGFKISQSLWRLFIKKMIIMFEASIFQWFFANCVNDNQSPKQNVHQAETMCSFRDLSKKLFHALFQSLFSCFLKKTCQKLSLIFKETKQQKTQSEQIKLLRVETLGGERTLRRSGRNMSCCVDVRNSFTRLCLVSFHPFKNRFTGSIFNKVHSEILYVKITNFPWTSVWTWWWPADDRPITEQHNEAEK